MQAGALTLLSVLLLVDKPRSFVHSAALSMHPNSVDDLQSKFRQKNAKTEKCYGLLCGNLIKASNKKLLLS